MKYTNFVVDNSFLFYNKYCNFRINLNNLITINGNNNSQKRFAVECDFIKLKMNRVDNINIKNTRFRIEEKL